MAIAGILTQTQASDLNFATSIQQWLYNQVVIQYNTAATALGLSQGAAMQSDGTWKPDTAGLGLIPGMPDDLSIYVRVPVIAYNLDYRLPKAPTPTGMGDGANNEWRSVSLCCLPAVTLGSDGTVQPNQQAQWLLKSFVANAINRTSFMPIVDRSQAQVGGNYPQIGYVELSNQRINSMDKIGQMLGSNRYRFDVMFDMKWAVSTTN